MHAHAAATVTIVTTVRLSFHFYSPSTKSECSTGRTYRKTCIQQCESFNSHASRPSIHISWGDGTSRDEETEKSLLAAIRLSKESHYDKVILRFVTNENRGTWAKVWVRFGFYAVSDSLSTPAYIHFVVAHPYQAQLMVDEVRFKL